MSHAQRSRITGSKPSGPDRSRHRALTRVSLADRRTQLAGVAALLLAVPLLTPPAAATTATVVRPTRVSGSSPLAGCTLDGVQRGQLFTNAEVEPYVAINPTDPNNLVATWQQDRYSNGGSQGIVTASSTDGGLTWRMNARSRSSVCTGGTRAAGGNFQRASDPWVTFSPDGTAHLMTLSFDQDNPNGTFGPNGMLSMRSVDGGQTWQHPVALRTDDSPRVLNDKNSMTADPHNPAFVYAVWDRIVVRPKPGIDDSVGPTWFARTVDGGRTWQPARKIFDPGLNSQTIGNQIVVLPNNGSFNGELVDMFSLILSGSPNTQVALVRSANRGRTWDAAPVVVDDQHTVAVRDPDTGEAVRAGDVIPEVAVDPNSGALYVVWQDSRFGPRNGVAFSRSLDGGLTWSPTIKVNATPRDLPRGDQQAFTPMVAVAADGTIAVSYFDFRNNTADPATLPTDAFVVRCRPLTPAACTRSGDWTDEQRLTPTSFDLARAPDAGGLFVGDYQGLAVDPGGQFLPLWSMPHAKDPANIFIERVAR